MDTITPFVRSLEQYDKLTEDERRILGDLPLYPKAFRKEEDIVRAGDKPDHSCVLLEGFAVRAQYLSDGRRQITNLHIPGDFVDLHSLFLSKMDHSVVAFSNCQVAFVPHNALKELVDENPHLMHLFWLTTLVDAAIDRAWITCLGRRLDIDHLAHFVCELFMRMQGRGLTDGKTFRFSATQAELADILGMSVVHINRTMQDLRKLGLIAWEDGIVAIRDFEGLAARAEFDPTYLNQKVERR